jgi:glycosyltransferase involved in cell wall biosynthesis
MQSGIESPDAGNRYLDADQAVWLGFVLILAGIEFSLLIKRRLRQAGAVQSSALMYRNKKVVVVMPAYNAARTLPQTYAEVRDQGLVDKIILVDDQSRDDTVAVARSLEGVEVHQHQKNTGYGGNQKTCYRLALEAGADIVIMIHPDYQYTPKLIPAMASMIANGLHPCVLGSRILGGYSLEGGMPGWKYVANRFLTFAENVLLGAKLSEYHTGYRAFSREILETLALANNSDDFVFDNQMLAQILWHGFTIGEVSCPTKYFKEASSINLPRSIKYGFGCLGTGLKFRLAKWGIARFKLFPPVSHGAQTAVRSAN